MTKVDSSDLLSLTSEQVEEQIQDLERLDSGATLLYAVDPHEVFDFCLPVFGSDAGRKDIKRIADDQIALYEVFFKFQPPPILLREYGPEMDQMLWHVRTGASKGFNRLEAVQNMLERPTDDESLEAYVLKNFNVLLAAVMDVYSTGAERLQRIASRLSQPLPADAANVLTDALSGYRVSGKAEQIFERLLKGMKFRDAFEEQKIRNSAVLDAKAIDKLAYVNECLIQAHREKRITKPVFCLYLSSSGRSSRIFRAKDRALLFPDLNGEPFNFWRTRAQIFSAIVHAGNDHCDTIARLRQFQRIQGSVRHIWEYARKLGSGYAGDIQSGLEELTGSIGEKLEAMRQEAANLGLLKNVAKFQELTKVSARDERTVKLFLEVCRETSRDTALEDMRTALRLMVSQSEFGSEASRSILTPNGSVSSRDPGRSVQYLAVRLDFKRETPHLATYQQLLELYTVYMQRGDAVRKLLDIYNQFLKDQPPQDDPEYEAIRCLLYLSFFTEEGNKKALNLSITLAPRHELYRYEFLHIASWAARRMGRIRDSISRAQECIRHFPADPRFHHTLALSWHSESDELVGAARAESLSKAVAELKDAIGFYRQGRGNHSDLIGTCYNSLAYFHSRSPADACFDLEAAHDALAQLKVYMPPNAWAPMHPEYFHTEANLEFQDYLLRRDQTAPNAERLRDAQKLIDRAITLSARETFRVLKADIENELLLLERGAVS